MKRIVRSAFSATVGILTAAPGWSSPIPYERMAEVTSLSVGTARTRSADHTLLFAEALVKYGQYQNYLHTWIDRPLFFDRALRPASMAYDTADSFRIHLREAIKYGMDGLGVFADRSGTYDPALEWTNDSGFDEVKLLPLFGYGESGVTSLQDVQKYVDLIIKAQASARSPRIGGKVLIGGYNYRLLSAEQRKSLHDLVREGVGNDNYLLVGDLENGVRSRLLKSFLANGALTEGEQAELEQAITAALEWTDGLQVTLSDFVRDPEGPYCSYYDFSFFSSCLMPALLKAYARSENAGKVLGAYVNQGYVNHMSGMNHGEFGTSTLRNAMSAVLALNPDFLVFFEWNEVNENTMFQPTVWNGQSVGRLIHYFADRMNGRAPRTYSDDDAETPPLVLSHPATFKPGEKVRFEILNIPSGGTAAAHTAQLRLEDADGHELVTFPAETLDAATLNAVTYSVPGEAFPAGSSVVPVLTADGRTYAGFQPVRCDATSRFIYKEARGSLRDLMAPARQTFEVECAGDGTYAFRADVGFDEPLASLELVADEEELAAYDVSNEYDRAENEIIRLAFTTRPGTGGNAVVGLRPVDADGMRLASDWKADVNPWFYRQKDGSFRIESYFFSLETPFLLTVPKSVTSTAQLEFDATESWNGTRAVLPVRTVLERGCWSAVLSEENGCRVEAVRVDNLPDIPFRPNRGDISWQGTVRCANPSPVFHLRAVSVNGHLWRSRPVCPSPAAGRTVLLGVYSEWTKGTAQVDVPESLVPEIDYVFSPETGAALANVGHPKYVAQLGGGFFDCHAMSEAGSFVGMSGGSFAPKWKQDADGSWFLRFDGADDFVTFPIETVPLGPFTLEMEFRPELSPTNMVLFRHSAQWRASICLFICDGRVYGMWADRDFDNPARSTARFDTGLMVLDGKWNVLKVSYDHDRMVFRLNGRQVEYPFDRRGYVFRPAIFGGHIVTSDITPSQDLAFFRGDLRRFAVSHRAHTDANRALFHWQVAPQTTGDFSDPANWSLSAHGNVNPEARLPGAEDCVMIRTANLGHWYWDFARFDLNGTTQTIGGYAAESAWRCASVDLTNGTLVVRNPACENHQSCWYTIRSGATLVYPDDGETHAVAPSGLMEGWTILSGGRGEMRGRLAVCGTSSDRVAYRVDPGGTLVFDPAFFSTTSCNYGRFGAVFENRGTFLAPHGVCWNGRSYNSEREAPDGKDRMRFRQVDGRMLLGGDFRKTARNWYFPGEMTFELAGGTLEVTNSVRFYTAEAAKDPERGWGEQVFVEMPAGATATVDVQADSTLDLMNATFGEETTLVKRGPGRLVLSAARRPTRIVREEGTVTVIKGTLTVRPVSLTLVVGSEAYGNGYRVEGLKDGDRAEDVVRGTPTYAFGGYTPGSPAGTYEISMLGLESDDYLLAYEPAPINVITPEDGRTFYWKGVIRFADYGAVSNWAYSADFSVPADRLPCAVDRLWGNGFQYGGLNFYTGFFDLGGGTHAIGGYSVGDGQMMEWCCCHVQLTNGTLTVVDPGRTGTHSRWYTVWNGATLIYPPSEDPCAVAPSGLMEHWTIKSGGRGEIRNYPIFCGLPDRLVAYLVEPGGEMVLDAFGIGTTSNNYGPTGAVIENRGTMLLPHGLNWRNRSYNNDSTGMEGEPKDRVRLRQAEGRMLLGGDFCKTARNWYFPGEMTFELAGGTLEVTNTVRFYTAEAAKDPEKGWDEQVFAEMPDGAAVAVDVRTDSVIDMTNFTFGRRTTLVKRGPGRIILGRRRPTVLTVQEGVVERRDAPGFGIMLR